MGTVHVKENGGLLKETSESRAFDLDVVPANQSRGTRMAAHVSGSARRWEWNSSERSIPCKKFGWERCGPSWRIPIVVGTVMFEADRGTWDSNHSWASIRCLYLWEPECRWLVRVTIGGPDPSDSDVHQFTPYLRIDKQRQDPMVDNPGDEKT